MRVIIDTTGSDRFGRATTTERTTIAVHRSNADPIARALSVAEGHYRTEVGSHGAIYQHVIEVLEA